MVVLVHVVEAVVDHDDPTEVVFQDPRRRGEAPRVAERQ
jgi:hypothetical protein